MSRFIQTLREINAVVMLTILMTGILLTLMQFDVNSEIHYYEVLWVPDYIFIAYIICEYVDRVAIKTALLLAAGTVIIPFSVGLTHTLFNLLVLAIIIIRTLYCMSKESDIAAEPPEFETVVLFFFLYLFAKHYNISPIPTVIVVFCLVYLCLILLSIFLKNMSKYLSQNRDFTNVAMSSLVKTDTIVFGIFLGLIFAGVLLFFFAPVDEIMDKIKDGFFTLIREPIKAILFIIALSPDIDYHETSINLEEYFKDAEPLVDSSIWKGPELVLKIVIYYFICRIIIKFIYSIIIKLKGSHAVMYDEITYTRPTGAVVKNIRQKSKVKKESKRSNVMKVRQEFIRLVKEHEYTYSHLFKSATPKAIVETMELEDENIKVEHDYVTVKDIYEKARYSNDEITKEDVNAMKKA
ncbi:MAG: hypothetical protein II699_07045 [Lachnospiraceae bacterium]|nr:hypothetical protein [Lachnospiraceae bacterium]